MQMNSSNIIIPNSTKNPKNIDVFWEDCIKEEPFSNNISFNKFLLKNSSNDNVHKNNYNNNKKKSQNKNKINEQNKTGIIKNCYNNLCEKIPNLNKEKQKNISKKKKIKNSIKRCLLLYSYGVEVQKANQANISQNKLHKEKEELKLCTWMPKLNNYKKINKKKMMKNQKSNENKRKKELNLDKKIIDMNIQDECTFKPKLNINSTIKLKKIFNRSKSMVLLTDRENSSNSSFIMRYKKARDEHMIKRFKELNEKDDSYNTSYKYLTTRPINEPYKNYLNVNTNINLQMQDKVLKKHKKKNKRVFNYSASYNNFLSNSNSKSKIVFPENNKSKQFYVGMLKKQLRLIDLEI